MSLRNLARTACSGATTALALRLVARLFACMSRPPMLTIYISANGAKFRAYTNGTDYHYYGTSLAAPLFASVITLINEERTAVGKGPVGFINPVLYASKYLPFPHALCCHRPFICTSSYQCLFSPPHPWLNGLRSARKHSTYLPLLQTHMSLKTLRTARIPIAVLQVSRLCQAGILSLALGRRITRRC